MYILRIEHPVPDFDGWKKAFDSDPLGRAQSGVRRYTITRPVNDEKYVLVDLEFDAVEQAAAMLNSLRRLWDRVDGRVMPAPVAQILRVVEAKGAEANNRAL
jgi:hypothetical protein